jgi:hypothetical protein
MRAAGKKFLSSGAEEMALPHRGKIRPREAHLTNVNEKHRCPRRNQDVIRNLAIVIAFRLYQLDRNNRIIGPAHIIECVDDDAAVIEARHYVDGHAIEIWRDDERIGLIPAVD